MANEKLGSLWKAEGEGIIASGTIAVDGMDIEVELLPNAEKAAAVGEPEKKDKAAHWPDFLLYERGKERKRGNEVAALWKPKADGERKPLGNGTLKVLSSEKKIVVWKNAFKDEDLRSEDAEKREKAGRSPDYYVALDRQQGC